MSKCITKAKNSVRSSIAEIKHNGLNYKIVPATLLAAGLLSLALPAQSSELDDMKDMIKELQQQVNQLKGQQAAAPAATAQPAAASPTTFVAGGAVFTIYGDADIYANHMTSSSGKTLNALEDGGLLRSRLGMKGQKPLTDDITGKFNLEQGFNVVNGKAADTAGTFTKADGTATGGTGAVYSGRLFDRQAWVGAATPYGEFRVGRQNTAIFYRGDYMDFGSRTIGGVINLFGVPSRYDADLTYISPRISGFMVEGHYSLAGANTTSVASQHVYQMAVDYLNGPYRVGYAGIVGTPNDAAVTYTNNVEYHNYYANYDYGRGMVYLAAVHSNNNGSNGTLPNGGSPMGNVGANANGITGTLVTGNVDTSTYYNVYQISADYKVTPTVRVGGLYGTINDTSGGGKNAKGWALGGFWEVEKNTKLYAMLDSIANAPNAGFTQSGSAGLSPNFSTVADVKGQKMTGVQLGVVYKF